MKRDDKVDARVGDLVLEALQGRCEDPEAAKAAIMEALLPVVGARALRRRSESQLMSAFREGYLSGKFAGRMARWHSQVWRGSQMFKTLREPANDQLSARYDHYNF